MENNETFNYTYSAKQQDEIEQIRKKYLPKTETQPSEYDSNLAQLRRLDASADRAGRVTALTLGVAGMVLFALGMCGVTVWADKMFAFGVALGVAGLAGMAAAYPLSRRAAARRREKIAPEVLRLADELKREQ